MHKLCTETSNMNISRERRKSGKVNPFVQGSGPSCRHRHRRFSSGLTWQHECMIHTLNHVFRHPTLAFLTTRSTIISRLKRGSAESTPVRSWDRIAPAMTKRAIPHATNKSSRRRTPLRYAAAFDPPKACDRSTDGDLWTKPRKRQDSWNCYRVVRRSCIIHADAVAKLREILRRSARSQ